MPCCHLGSRTLIPARAGWSLGPLWAAVGAGPSPEPGLPCYRDLGQEEKPGVVQQGFGLARAPWCLGTQILVQQVPARVERRGRR